MKACPKSARKREEEARKTRFHSSNETHAEEAEQEKEETQ